jgi:hypothetical protein
MNQKKCFFFSFINIKSIVRVTYLKWFNNLLLLLLLQYLDLKKKDRLTLNKKTRSQTTLTQSPLAAAAMDVHHL